TSYETLLDGFLPGRGTTAPGGFAAQRAALGRPVDVLQMTDGSILISDDTGNRLLRLSYGSDDVADRNEVTINDTDVAPENLTSSQDGTVYFGSTAKGTIYRAAPGASVAEPW